jgi:hypothetical protein
MKVLVLSAVITVATIVGANAADFIYPPPVAPPLRRLRCPNMAWFHTRQSRLPLLSSLGQRRLLIITHQSHPRCSGLRRMASDRRCLPREPSCRAQRAHRYGAAGIAVAIGSRAAHHLPSATTAAPMSGPANRSTPAPTHRRLASATSARTRLKSTQVQLAPMRALAAPTANKFGLIREVRLGPRWGEPEYQSGGCEKRKEINR